VTATTPAGCARASGFDEVARRQAVRGLARSGTQVLLGRLVERFESKSSIDEPHDDIADRLHEYGEFRRVDGAPAPIGRFPSS
jgi:hypothetical protein